MYHIHTIATCIWNIDFLLLDCINLSFVPPHEENIVRKLGKIQLTFQYLNKCQRKVHSTKYVQIYQNDFGTQILQNRGKHLEKWFYIIQPLHLDIVNKSSPNSLNWVITSESRQDSNNKWINRGRINIFKDVDPIVVAILLVMKPMWMAFGKSPLNHREKNIAA